MDPQFRYSISKRLTIHEGYESNPIWNNSGDKLAFSSNRKGVNNVFLQLKKMEEYLNN